MAKILKPCPQSPNCVSTQAEDKKHRMEPISYGSTLEEAKNKIKYEKTQAVED